MPRCSGGYLPTDSRICVAKARSCYVQALGCVGGWSTAVSMLCRFRPVMSARLFASMLPEQATTRSIGDCVGTEATTQSDWGTWARHQYSMVERKRSKSNGFGSTCTALMALMASRHGSAVRTIMWASQTSPRHGVHISVITVADKNAIFDAHFYHPPEGGGCVRILL